MGFFNKKWIYSRTSCFDRLPFRANWNSTKKFEFALHFEQKLRIQTIAMSRRKRWRGDVFWGGWGRKGCPNFGYQRNCSICNELQSFAKLYRPEKASTSVLHVFNDVVMRHFQKVLTRRTTLDMFLTKRKKQTAEFFQPKRFARKSTPPVELPDVFKRGDFTSEQ